ncbi:MAG: HAD family hydrolase [Prevotella sp.]|nr:HAD family hydrolase [Staphylococcus sp.]MCM1350436.1 HAD family hydrolase [Prevotella sp.]
MKKIVCMDLGNTIIHNDVLCFEIGYEKLYSVVEKTSISVEEWKQSMHQLYLYTFATREKDCMEIPFQQFLKKAMELMNVQTQYSLDDLEYLFYQAATMDSIEKDIFSFFSFLKAKNIPIYVISNSTFSKRCLLDTLIRLGLNGYIVEVYSSADVGIRKPDARFFDRLTALQSFSKEEILYIGNDAFIDYNFAKNSGIEFIWYNPEKQKKDIMCQTIENYQELIEIWGEKFD